MSIGNQPYDGWSWVFDTVDAICYNPAQKRRGHAPYEDMSYTPLAYLDPGTGSLFLQLLLGGIAGLVVILKLYWHKILAFLGIRKTQPGADASEEQGGTEEKVAGSEVDEQ